MADISDIKLELPLLGGNKFRVVVKYRITFHSAELCGEPAQYRHVVRLFGDDTNTGDGDDGHDENIGPNLLNEVITAQSSPLVVSLNMGPYNIALLNEDPEWFVVPARDEIRARVTLTPADGKPWATVEAQSNMVQQAFEPA